MKLLATILEHPVIYGTAFALLPGLAKEIHEYKC